MNTNNEPTTEEIAARAQELWEDEGRPEGKADEHWKRAEIQLRQQQTAQNQQSKKRGTKPQKASVT